MKNFENETLPALVLNPELITQEEFEERKKHCLTVNPGPQPDHILAEYFTKEDPDNRLYELTHKSKVKSIKIRRIQVGKA